MRHIEEIVVIDIGGQLGPVMVQIGRNGVTLLVERQEEGFAAVERHGDLRMARVGRFVRSQVDIYDLALGYERPRSGRCIGSAGGPAPGAAFRNGNGIGGADLAGQHDSGFVLIAAGDQRRRLRVEERCGTGGILLSAFRRAACTESQDEDRGKQRTSPRLQHPDLQCHLRKKVEKKSTPDETGAPPRVDREFNKY